jgi:tetratricopeptide (TPR) repeat protein
MDYDPPEDERRDADRPRRSRGQAEDKRSERGSEEENPRPVRPPRERNLPNAEDLARTTSGAVARGRTTSSGRTRRPLPARPHSIQKPEVALRKMVGEVRAKSLTRRLNEAGRAFASDRFNDARNQIATVVKEAPQLPEGRELMGLVHYRMGRWKEAIVQLEAFREITGSTEQHPVLADCHRALGHWDDVDELWAELGDASPSAELVIEGRLVVAGSHADRGDLTTAIRILEHNWRVPKRPQGHHLRRAYALADLYDRAGRTPRARELFRWVAEYAPDLADVKARVKALG